MTEGLSYSNYATYIEYAWIYLPKFQVAGANSSYSPPITFFNMRYTVWGNLVQVVELEIIENSKTLKIISS